MAKRIKKVLDVTNPTGSANYIPFEVQGHRLDVQVVTTGTITGTLRLMSSNLNRWGDGAGPHQAHGGMADGDVIALEDTGVTFTKPDGTAGNEQQMVENFNARYGAIRYEHGSNSGTILVVITEVVE